MKSKLAHKHAGKVRRMKPIRGFARIPLSAYMTAQIERHIHTTQVRFGVSRSFVIAVACAEFFGVRNHERF